MTTEVQPRKPLDQMRECWESDRCVCGNLKRTRQDWFCRMCWWSLPKEIKNPLLYRPYKAITQWLAAVAMLKKNREK